ncbi:response regulator [bacterium]|nr:response regulator [bacterium]
MSQRALKVMAGASLAVVMLFFGWARLSWERETNQKATRQLAHLLAPEVLVDAQKSAVWQRFQSLPGLEGGELLAGDGHALANFGTSSGDAYECPLIESGQLVGTLRLHYAPPTWGWAWVSTWLVLLAAPLGWTLYRLPKQRLIEEPTTTGALLLEVDENDRILQMKGTMNGPAVVAIGQSLSDAFPDKLVHREDSPGGPSSLVVVRDTQAWEGLKKRVQELKDHYRSLCDHAHDLILVCQPEGTLVFANKAMLQIFPQLEAGSIVWSLFESASQELAREKFRESVLAGEASFFQAQMSVAQGQALHVEGSFCPGLVDSGVAVTVLGIFRDLTRQRKAEAELRHAQKMEAIGRLAGGVAHDFNNLLTVMGSVSSLIQFEPEDSPTRWEHLSLLDETVDRAAELTRQLLLFSRPRNCACTPLDVDTVLADLLRLAQRLLGEDIALHTELQSRCWLMADRSELEQVAMNLLVNARDAMPDGGRLDVVSRCCQWRGAPAVQLEFRDSGCGMSEELVQRIFEPYFTTKESGKGTGLGLSTSYAIINRLKGSVKVNSKPGQGTTFLIHLPATMEAPPAQSVVGSEVAPARKNELVLLVEDDERLCESTTKTLRMLSYEVASAISPQTALEWLENSQRCPNILVTDLIMPGMNGAELARRARQIHPDLKVLFVSGYPGDALEELDPNGLEFLPKPYRGAELNTRIRKILDPPVLGR